MSNKGCRSSAGVDEYVNAVEALYMEINKRTVFFVVSRQKETHFLVKPKHLYMLDLLLIKVLTFFALIAS